jgi:hypothetical protein
VEVVLADVVVWSELGARSSRPSSAHPASRRATAHVANTQRIGRVCQVRRAQGRQAGRDRIGFGSTLPDGCPAGVP